MFQKRAFVAEGLGKVTFTPRTRESWKPIRVTVSPFRQGKGLIMSETLRTSELNGRLWGARSADWANHQEHVHKPVYKAVLDAASVKVGTRFLDVGCGAGMTVKLAVDRGAVATGLDAAENLLNIASLRAPTAAFHKGDLEELPFSDGEFDVVSGINSFQYAGNPVSALSEARRVVGKNGKVVIVTWGEPEGMEAAKLIGAIKPLMPPPPLGAPGPFALSDKNALRGFAEHADLEVIEIFDVDCPFEYTDIETAVRGMSSAGVAVKVMEMAGEKAVEEAYRNAFAEFQKPDGSVRVGAAFRCLVARPSLAL